MTDPLIASGCCYVLFAYDVGLAIRLDEAASLVDGWTRGTVRSPPPTPRYLDFKTPPLRAFAPAEPVALGAFATDTEVEAAIFDFGAVSLTYRIPLAGPFSGLVPLSSNLYENQALLADSRRVVGDLLASIERAVSRPKVGRFVEDYALFQIAAFDGAEGVSAARTVEENRESVAQVLRSETRRLSSQEIDDALSSRLAYGADDDAIVDWNGALLFHDEVQDVRTVLEYANVQLLEMRWLDEQLDQTLDRSYDVLGRRAAGGSWRRSFPLIPYREIHRIAQLQTDGAVLFEGVSNALKLVGDQYLARLYRLAARRMRLPEWDASIARKLHTAESIYEKLSDQAATRRLEALEWIIIALIAVSILMAL